MTLQTRTPRMGQSGFTLIELMVVVTIIAVLAIVGVPYFRAYMLESRLDEALPTMTPIAAKMRLHRYETGKYCCEGESFDEAVITVELGVRVADSGDFCYMSMCPSAALCASSSPGFFASSPESGDATPEFEVIALLRASGSGSTPRNSSPQVTPSASRSPGSVSWRTRWRPFEPWMIIVSADW